MSMDADLLRKLDDLNYTPLDRDLVKQLRRKGWRFVFTLRWPTAYYAFKVARQWRKTCLYGEKVAGDLISLIERAST